KSASVSWWQCHGRDRRGDGCSQGSRPCLDPAIDSSRPFHAVMAVLSEMTRPSPNHQPRAVRKNEARRREAALQHAHQVLYIPVVGAQRQAVVAVEPRARRASLARDFLERRKSTDESNRLETGFATSA